MFAVFVLSQQYFRSHSESRGSKQRLRIKAPTQLVKFYIPQYLDSASAVLEEQETLHFRSTNVVSEL